MVQGRVQISRFLHFCVGYSTHIRAAQFLGWLYCFFLLLYAIYFRRLGIDVTRICTFHRENPMEVCAYEFRQLLKENYYLLLLCHSTLCLGRRIACFLRILGLGYGVLLLVEENLEHI
jgi:hypothetical protein